MKCQECDQPATMHITEARQMAAVGEQHLCDAHAHQYFQEHPPGVELDPGIVGVPAPPDPEDAVRLDLVRVIINEVSDLQLMVLQEVAGRRTVPIVTGIFEATALDRRLKGLAAPRPLTHDAWAGAIKALGGHVQDVLIYDLRQHTYYVWLRMGQSGRVVTVEVRPSDGIILAVLLGAPILIARRVLDEVSEPAG